MITVIIPAVNEPDIDLTIRSVLEQTVPVDRIIVAINNSNTTDVTTAPALSFGDSRIEVRNLGDCPGRKAESINKVLDTLSHNGFVMIMDADTTITPKFVEHAMKDLERSEVAATGAVFQAEEAESYLALCQRLEWIRYASEIDRTGRTWVLSGTAAIIKWEALESVYERFGRYYDETSITEDGRLSVDLKVCGWKITSPVACAATTEIMPTWRLLIKQRTRWFLGALQTVSRAPLTKASFPYLGQQIMLSLSVALLWTIVGITTYAAVSGSLQLSIFWSLIGLIFVIERVVTIPKEPLKHKAFAMSIFPELVYALVLQWAFLRAIFQFMTRSRGEWTHVESKVA